MPFSIEDKHLIKVLRQQKLYGATKILNNQILKIPKNKVAVFFWNTVYTSSFSLPHIIECLIFLEISHIQAENGNGSSFPVPEVEYLINLINYIFYVLVIAHLNILR